MVFVLCTVPLFTPGQSKYISKKKGPELNSGNANYYKNTTTVSRSDDNISIYLDSAQYLSALAPMRAIDLINKAVELSIKSNDRSHEAQAYLILGNIQQSLSQHELAIENYNKCISVFDIKVKRKIAEYTDVSQTTLFNANKNKALSLLALERLSEAESSINNCFLKGSSVVRCRARGCASFGSRAREGENTCKGR